MTNLTSGKLNLQIEPTFNGVLDKRSYGSMNARPTKIGPGLMRYEPDNNGGALVFFDGTSWNDVSTGGTSFPSLGYKYDTSSQRLYLWNNTAYNESTMLSTSLPKWFLRYQADGVDYLELNGQRIAIRETWTTNGTTTNKTMVDIANHAIYLTAPVYMAASGQPNTMTVSQTAVTIGTNESHKELVVQNSFQVTSSDVKVLNGSLTVQRSSGEDSVVTVDGEVKALSFKVYDDQTEAYIPVTTTAITPALLGKLPDNITPIDVTMTTNETIGDIPKGTSVDTLVNNTAYNTVQKLIAKMLKIGPEVLVPLVAREVRLTMSYTSVGLGSGEQSSDVRICTTIKNIDLQFSYDRGYWSPTQTSGGTHPGGVITGISFQEPFTNTQVLFPNMPSQVTQSILRYVVFSAQQFMSTESKLPSDLQTIQFSSLINATILQGADAYNKSLGPFYFPGSTTFKVSNTIQFHLYAEVYRVSDNIVYLNDTNGLQGEDGYSGQDSTTRVFESTTTIIAANFDPNHILSIPYYDTFDLYQYSVQLGNKFNLQFYQPDPAQPRYNESTFTVTPVSRAINGVLVPYYKTNLPTKGVIQRTSRL